MGIHRKPEGRSQKPEARRPASRCSLLTSALCLLTSLALPLGASETASHDESASPTQKGIRLGRQDKSAGLNTQAQSFVVLQHLLTEGYYNHEVDLEDVNGYFWHIFSRLPDQVTVYPSENYYYFIDHVAGRQIWGNIRLAATERERGVLPFAYSEFNEFAGNNSSNRFTRSKHFSKADGLAIKSKDPFTWVVTYNKKSVTFHLHQLSLEPPRSFALKTNEVFIARTFDESGIQFFLLFNTTGNYFFWVLNEEEIVPDEFTQLDKDILVGRRTGFAFWIDPEKKPRKVLASVRKLSVTRNDYFDGPFDQLADNYVEHNKISQWMERAIPSTKGRIDKYGYYTDRERPYRVALACYGNYHTTTDVINMVQRAKASSDPYQLFSRRGVTTTSEQTPASNPYTNFSFKPWNAHLTNLVARTNTPPRTAPAGKK